jgi:hypothetical protein
VIVRDRVRIKAGHLVCGRVSGNSLPTAPAIVIVCIINSELKNPAIHANEDNI